MNTRTRLPALRGRPSTAASFSPDTAVDVDNLVVKFGDLTAVSQMNLQVQAGEVHALLGPNGSGKTTLVSVIATLLQPTSGTVRVNGHDVTVEPVAVRRAIGLAGQSAAVDGLLTGRENLEIIGRLYGLNRASSRQRAGEVLERLSLTHAGDRPVRTYSGGMRRRLDLGASLAGRPQVLLLDEPTTGLDPRTRLELWDFLRDLVAQGTTVLLTTQYLEEADALAERITVIDRGEVIAAGTSDELKSSIGASHLVVTLGSPDDVPAAVAAVERAVGLPARCNSHEGTISLPVTDHLRALLTVAHGLDQAGIAVRDIAVKRPSLDDVFLEITGPDVEAQQ